MAKLFDAVQGTHLHTEFGSDDMEESQIDGSEEYQFSDDSTSLFAKLGTGIRHDCTVMQEELEAMEVMGTSSTYTAVQIPSNVCL